MFTVLHQRGNHQVFTSCPKTCAFVPRQWRCFTMNTFVCDCVHCTSVSVISWCILKPWIPCQNKPQIARQIKLSGGPCRISLKQIILLHTTQIDFTGSVDPVQRRRRISNWVAPTSRTNTVSWTHVTVSLPWYHVRAPSAILTENRSWSPPSSKLGHESSLEKVTSSDSIILLKVSFGRKQSRSKQLLQVAWHE